MWYGKLKYWQKDIYYWTHYYSNWIQAPIPEICADQIITLYHSSLFAGHQGVIKTYITIAKKFFMSDCMHYLHFYIKGCHICQLSKKDKIPTRQFQARINLNYRPLSRLSMDLKVMPKSHKGHVFTLSVIDEMTNYLITVSKYHARSEEIGDALIDNVISKYGIPEYIIMDQYSAFAGHQGVIKTYITIAKKFFMSDCMHYLHFYIKGCHICQLSKKDKIPTRQFQARINLNYRPLSRLSMDLKVMPKSHKGHMFTLSVIDEMTNYLITVSKYHARSEEIGDALIDNVISKYGIPEYIIMDQYSAFMSILMSYLFKRLNIRIKTVAHASISHFKWSMEWNH